MKEIWRDIKGYEGQYQVSNLGRVKSFRFKTRILKACKTTNGYLVINLPCLNGMKTNNVHKLVAEAFLGCCPEGKEVRHGPNGKQDNAVSNLSYGTRAENFLDKRRDGTHNGLPVWRSDGRWFMGHTVAAEETGGTETLRRHISHVVAGERKSAGGYKWACALGHL